ncbi:MAG: hypothetical protein SGJ11_08640 [Phycisphaerae bacterium]|nr:hypothetical protein [Phycisphaerae bacterium]
MARVCPECAYPVANNSTIFCPECGTVVPALSAGLERNARDASP